MRKISALPRTKPSSKTLKTASAIVGSSTATVAGCGSSPVVSVMTSGAMTPEPRFCDTLWKIDPAPVYRGVRRRMREALDE